LIKKLKIWVHLRGRGVFTSICRKAYLSSALPGRKLLNVGTICSSASASLWSVGLWNFLYRSEIAKVKAQNGLAKRIPQRFFRHWRIAQKMNKFRKLGPAFALFNLKDFFLRFTVKIVWGSIESSIKNRPFFQLFFERIHFSPKSCIKTSAFALFYHRLVPENQSGFSEHVCGCIPRYKIKHPKRALLL
jgi:hypothetical protein